MPTKENERPVDWIDSTLTFLDRIPSGLWAFVGVILGLFINGRKDKRAASERRDMRKEERQEREAIRDQEREAAWKPERLAAHARFSTSARQAQSILHEFITEETEQPRSLKRMQKVEKNLNEQFSELELVATDQVANAALQCLLAVARARMFLSEYEGPANPYRQASMDEYMGLDEELDYFHDPHKIADDIATRYSEFIAASRMAQGLRPLLYSGPGL